MGFISWVKYNCENRRPEIILRRKFSFFHTAQEPVKTGVLLRRTQLLLPPHCTTPGGDFHLLNYFTARVGSMAL